MLLICKHLFEYVIFSNTGCKWLVVSYSREFSPFDVFFRDVMQKYLNCTWKSCEQSKKRFLSEIKKSNYLKQSFRHLGEKSRALQVGEHDSCECNFVTLNPFLVMLLLGISELSKGKIIHKWGLFVVSLPCFFPLLFFPADNLFSKGLQLIVCRVSCNEVFTLSIGRVLFWKMNDRLNSMSYVRCNNVH